MLCVCVRIYSSNNSCIVSRLRSKAKMCGEISEGEEKEKDDDEDEDKEHHHGTWWWW